MSELETLRDAVARVRAVLAEERAWLEHLVESGDACPRVVIGIGKVEAALDGAPEPGLSESERLEIDGTPYVFSPDSLSYQIDGWVHDLGLPGDSMLREFGVQDGSYFEDPTVLSEKLQEVTIAWLEEHGYRRGGAPEPDNDDPCDAEVYSWDHFRPEQIDSYWIRCTLPGKHNEHEDSHTGLKWRSGLPVEGESSDA